MRRPWLIAAFAYPLWCAPPVAEEARQVLARRCIACHSPQAKSSGLDLTTRDAALRGGTQKASLLARVERGEMPPAKKLPESEIEILQRWQAAGSPAWTDAITPQRSGPDWWAFQPLRRPPAEFSLDQAIRAKLAEKGWTPAPPADRRTLIRRVTFGLTGLPPTPEEIRAFEADARPDAYARLIDQLLARPSYGEHWARHWLDVVRYSESEGFERDWLRDHAWPYRDYVIRSFNADKPYAQFVREQIAGDVLTPPTHEGLIATSLLALGPYDAVGLTSAVEQERQQVRADQMEEIVGVVSQTFLGLTVNCARCHDHKFDPLPQRDYYRLKAVFDGIWQPTIGAELKADGRLVLTPAELARHQERIAQIRQRLQAAEMRLAEHDRAEQDRAQHKQAARPQPATTTAPVAHWRLDTDARDDLAGVHAPALPDNVNFDEGRLRPAAGKETVSLPTAPLTFDLREKTLEAWIYARTAPEKSLTILQIRNRSGFRGAALDGLRFTGGKKKQWINTSTVNFRTEEVNGPPEDTPAGGRIHMAITYAANGEIRLYRNGQPYGRAYQPDKGTPHGHLQTYGKGDAIVEFGTGYGLELEQARLFARALSPVEIQALFEAGVTNAPPVASPARDRLTQELANARKDLAAAQAEPAKAFAATPRADDAGRLAPTHLLIRGDVSRPGAVVTPGAVSCLPYLSGDLDLPADALEAERRRRLADWITRPDNALAARVIVNRVWHYHFGAGLVDSPNDFGFNGGQPSHPELLDYLAAEFQQSGGSLKQLHRLILNSQTYRQSSQFQSAAAAQDAGARLLWRFPPQRLPAEAVRDAMLAASGALNPQMYGPSFRPFQIVKNAGSYHSYEPIDSDDAAFQRRTIYRMNINSGGNPLLDALDCPLPSMKTPKRSATTTALQALSLMNNPFAERMARTLAGRVSREHATTADRIARAYALTLGRAPRPEELSSAAALAEKSGLAALCWALFNLSEFLYVE